MTDQIRAPWTPEQVAALNAFQQRGGMHPFTCGGDHTPGSPTLIAYTDGWRCPQPYGEACDYRQDWAAAFMADPDAWPKSPFGSAATEATERPTLRERHRAQWLALTDTERAARIAALDEDDEPEQPVRTTVNNPVICELPHQTVSEEDECERERLAPADGTACSCGGRFPIHHLHADEHRPVGEPAAWTPPPPGDRREQLPDDVLDLIRGGMPDYTSTACVTAYTLAVAVHWSHPRRAELGRWSERMHSRCRRNMKFTGALCICPCHQGAAAEPPVVELAAPPRTDVGTEFVRQITECEADDLTGAWMPDPPIRCLTVTVEPPAPRDPCPHCESSSERVPRHLMAEHVATVHPEMTAGGAGTPAPDAEPAPLQRPGLREQLHAAIVREVYEYREVTPLWGETEGVTQEIARLATRGAMSVLNQEERP